MAYAAEWELDDAVLDREEVEAVVQHVAGLGQVSAEVTPSRRGLHCTFRFPVHAATDVVTALDPAGKLLGDEWYKDLDPPIDGEEGYTVRVELLGPVDGGRVDDEPADDHEDDDDEPICVARLRVESFDNREAWPVAFAIATAIVERLGGDLRDDFDEDLYLQQLHLPQVVVPGGAPPPPTGQRPPVTTIESDDGDDDRMLN